MCRITVLILLEAEDEAWDGGREWFGVGLYDRE